MSPDLPYRAPKPVITIPGDDPVTVEVSPPDDTALIREAATANAVIAVVPGAPELVPLVQELVDHLDAIRTGEAQLAFAEYRGATLEHGLTDARIKLRGRAERFLFSGLHLIEEPTARLVHIAAVLPAISLAAEIRVPSAQFGKG